MTASDPFPPELSPDDVERRLACVQTGLTPAQAIPGVDEAWHRLERALATSGHADTAGSAVAPPTKSANRSRLNPFVRPRVLPRQLMIGLGCALAVCLAGLAYLTQQVTSVTRHYATASGVRRTVTLLNDASVTLAPNTSLLITETSSGTRVVLGAGEAYFQIAHASATPFEVRAGAVVTRVLGTRFDVVHDLLRHDVRVAVVSGRVSVARAGHTNSASTLSANMVGRLTDSTIVIADDGAAAASSWVDGRLVFRGETVAQMLTKVGQWYGYEFRLSDSVLAAQHVTTQLVMGDRAETMNDLKDLLDVTMTFDGPVITLHPRRGSTIHRPKARQDDRTLSPPKEFGK